MLKENELRIQINIFKENIQMTNSYMKRSSNTINHKQNANEKHNEMSHLLEWLLSKQ